MTDNNDDNLRVSISRRTFLKGVGLLSASAALAACSPTTGASVQSTSSAASSSTASLAASSAASSGEPSGTSATPLLAIIHTNDTHGHDDAVEGTDSTRGNFSMAAVAALKSDWEQKGYEVLLVDAGDVSQGTPFVDTTNGASAIAFMNACGYDLMAVGNHEFDWGVDALAANEKTAEFPFLSANVLDKKTGERRFPANKVIELNSGAKIGFFGLTTPATLTSAKPDYVSDFTFLADDDLYACAQAQVDELRGQGCDIVACVGHLGNDVMDHSASKDVLQNVTGIDLFIDGHDHEEVNEEVGGTLLVETGCYMHNIGVVLIDEGAPTGELVAAGSYDGIDKTVQAIIDEEAKRVESELNVVLGSTPFFLNGERDPGLRTEETNLGDFCTDAYRWAASTAAGRDVDAALINAGGLRTSIDAGDITLGDIKALLPFSDDLSVVNVTGAQLLEVLEAACQAVGKSKPIAAFPQVSGITFTVDASVPYEEGPKYPDSRFASPANPGARVTITDVAGRGFDEKDTYSVAASAFICMGGDTYYAFESAAKAEPPESVGFDYEAFASYLVEYCKHEVPAEYEKPQGRITITGLS